MDQFVPMVIKMADSSEEPMWEHLKTQSDVNVYRLPVHPGSHNEQWATMLPHMVKGVTVFPKSLPDLYSFLLHMSFDFRKKLDPLVTNFETKEVQNNKQLNEASICRCRFDPPTWILSARDFVFCTRTYLFDTNGEEIPLPSNNDHLDEFVKKNQEKIGRIVMLSRSVYEEELEKCKNKKDYQLASGDVRGFIRCIAYVLVLLLTIYSWVIDRIDDTSCRGQTLSELDVAGYVPEFVKGLIAQHNANGVVTLRTWMDENLN
jgi:hypothetical protein